MDVSTRTKRIEDSVNNPKDLHLSLDGAIFGYQIGKIVIISGYTAVTMGAWETKTLISGLPKPCNNTYGQVATPAGSAIFCSLYREDGTLRIESKDNAITHKNVFFSIVYASI